MRIEKRTILVNIGVFLILLFLPLNKLLILLTDKTYFLWIFLALIVLVLVLIVLAYTKLEEKIITVKKISLDINKYLIYIYLPLYIVFTVTKKEELSIKVLILISSLILVSLISIVYNVIVYLKNED